MCNLKKRYNKKRLKNTNEQEKIQDFVTRKGQF